MRPDDVCEAYGNNKRWKRITIQIDEDMVLVEGEAEALEFVGNLFLAQAKYEKDCSFFLGPKTAGRAFFTKKSTHGLYIHRLPCLEKPRDRSA